MQRKHAFLKIIACILIHSFLLFDLSWAGGFQSSSAAPATCLNAPLRMADKSFSSALIEMIHSDQTAVLNQDGLIPLEKALSPRWGRRPFLRQSAKVFFKTIAMQLYGLLKAARVFADDDNVINVAIKHVGEEFEYYLIGLGFVVVIVAIIYIERINNDSRKEENKKTLQNKVLQRPVFEQRKISYLELERQARLNGDYAEIIKLLKERGLENPQDHVILSSDEQDRLMAWITTNEAVSGKGFLRTAISLSYKIIAVQRTIPERLQPVLQIADKLSRWYVVIDGNGYKTNWLDDYFRRLESMKLGHPEHLKKLGAQIDKEIELVESGQALYEKDRIGKQYVPKSHPRAKVIIAQNQAVIPAIASRGRLIQDGAVLHAI